MSLCPDSLPTMMLELEREENNGSMWHCKLCGSTKQHWLLFVVLVGQLEGSLFLGSADFTVVTILSLATL